MKMPFQISYSLPTSEIPNLEKFIKKLRRYKKNSVIETGLSLLWMIFKDKNSFPETTKDILVAYGPKIIILALAVSNNCRNEVVDTKIFYELCNDYIGIKESIRDEEILNSEANDIIKILNLFSL